MTKSKTIMLIVTYRCNLHCTYCYEPKSLHKRMTAEQAKSYITKAVDSLDSSYTEFEVQFMGGEPLMEFSLIKEISEWLWSRTWPIPLSHVFAATNGTLLNDEMKEWFSENRERACLGISFDGNRLMQNMNRSDSYDEVDLSFFASLWPGQSVKMTLSPDSVGYLYDGVMHLHSYGLNNVVADLASGNKVRWEQKHLALFYEQLQKLADYYVVHPDYPRVSLLDLDVISVLGTGEKRFKHCGCGETFSCIDCDGTVYPCHLFSPVSATPEQVEEAKTIDFTNHSHFVSEKCRNCLLIDVCPRCCGMNFQCQGDVSEPSPFICAAFKIQFAVNCRMQFRLAELQGNQARCDEIQRVIECLTNIAYL